MRELVYYVAVSLDGYVAGPDGSSDAFLMEGDHMEALMHSFTDAIPWHVQQAVGLKADRRRFDTVILGWNSYAQALDEGITSPYAHLRQIVATRQRREAAPEIELTGDPVATVTEMKRQDGAGIYLAGGGELAGALVDEIDRLVLKVNPVVLGSGVPLFASTSHANRRFDQVDGRQFESGVLLRELVRRT